MKLKPDETKESGLMVKGKIKEQRFKKVNKKIKKLSNYSAY